MARHDKAALKQQLLALLEGQLATARAAHTAATEGAIGDEARPENDKDTRGLEQSYLARGHAGRVAELETGIVAVTAVSTAPSKRAALGAVVEVEEDGETRALYLAGAGGGLVLEGGVTVVTPTSPMGRALLGKGEDDECELVAGGTQRMLVITSIA
jgi:transcription elongation GreA/GreB family factor